MTVFSVPQTDIARAALVGLDWGTSSLRSYLFDAHGQVLAGKTLPWGVMRLPDLPSADRARQADSPGVNTASSNAAARLAAFELAFEAACGDWLDAHPGLPAIACGMVGSAQGWLEVPYVERPMVDGAGGVVDAEALARALGVVATRGGRTLHIVPGVLERGGLPNVMRGEETQIVGVGLSRPAHPAGLTGDGGGRAAVLIGLPGTHAKWALSAQGRIGHFDTFMTGEVFALLREHSILGRTMTPSAQSDRQAFLHGLGVARAAAGSSLLATIFSVRTMGLTGQLATSQQADYLSGLLIGDELASLERSLARDDGRQLAQRDIVLTGDAELCERYGWALAAFGCASVEVIANATETGLWHIAVQAGLTGGADDRKPAAVARHAGTH
jgi:2-dehydro-3-deoxygalactonokinase